MNIQPADVSALIEVLRNCGVSYSGKSFCKGRPSDCTQERVSWMDEQAGSHVQSLQESRKPLEKPPPGLKPSIYIRAFPRV
jgi:hypothetical protein